MTIEDLKTQRRWIVWRLTKRPDGTTTKEPMSPGGYKASIKDPANWYTFAEVEPIASKFSGIGLVLGDLNGTVPYVWGVDIDRCVSDTGQFSPESREIVIGLDSYSELSPSGTGAHVLGMGGRVPQAGKAEAVVSPFRGCKQLEIKADGWYFTVTGQHLTKTPKELCERGDALAALVRRVRALEKPHKPGLVLSIPQSEEERLRKLMAGDMSDYEGNHSAADFALCVLLAKKHGCNAFRIEEEFNKSPLGLREKWLARADYRQGTITKAIIAAARSTPLSLADDAEMPVDSPEEYIVEPTGEDGIAGWAPVGEINLVGGASGIGKTSLLMHVAELIREGRDVCGHPAKAREYRFLSYDRSVRGFRRTAKALRMPEVADRILRVSPEERRMPVGETLDKYAELYPQVGLWIVEGLDLTCTNPSDMDEVSTLLEGVERVAGRRRLGVIGTVGSAKQKVGEGYVLSRDKLFGSVAWARRSETVIFVDLYNAENPNGVRRWTVLPRDGKEERFYFEFSNGLRLCGEPEAKPINEVFDAMSTAVFTKFKPGERVMHCAAFGAKSTFYDWRKLALQTGQLVQSGKDVLVPFVAPDGTCPLCRK